MQVKHIRTGGTGCMHAEQMSGWIPMEHALASKLKYIQLHM